MVNQNSFWGFWCEGMEIPFLYNTHQEAKEHAESRARTHPPVVVHLLKAEAIGTIYFPNAPVRTGEMS